MPTLRVDDLSRTQIIKYLGASGDFNPLHHDDEFARRAGLETVIAPGMFIASLASSALTDWIPIGTVERFRTRFTDTVQPGDNLVVRGEVVSINQENISTIIEVDLSVENNDGIVLDGDATVRIDEVLRPNLDDRPTN
jgi:acyl dehydratase